VDVVPDGRPRVSVVVTTHRTPAPLLEGALASLAAQTLTDHEVVVVCDGEPGPAQQDVLDAADQDPRVRVLHPGRIGRGAALNLGVAATTAPLVAIQDADDESHPCRLEWQAAAVSAHPEVALLGTAVVRTRDQAAHADWPLPPLAPPPRTLGRRVLFTNPLVHSSVLVRRDVLADVGGYDEARRWQFDHDLYLRLHDRGWTLATLTVPLALKRLHLAQAFEGADPVARLWSSYRLQLSHARGQPGAWPAALVAGATARFGARSARIAAGRLRRRVEDRRPSPTAPGPGSPGEASS
jgi:glycosyltransferase involved in cell wall biosynthesis